MNLTQKSSQYCAVSIFHLRYKGQFVDAVFKNISCSKIFAKYRHFSRGLISEGFKVKLCGT